MPQTLLVVPRFSAYRVDSAREDVHLAEYDLWMTFIKNVHVIPADIDVQKFCDALAISVGVYRHACGRIRSDNNRWRIKLTDSAIPVGISSTDVLRLDNNWVIQDDLSALLTPTPAVVVNTDVSLLSVKITKAQSNTAIGISWHHALGDAECLLRFMHLLSQTYQNLVSSYPPPSFQKHLFPVSSRIAMNTFRPLMPHLTETFNASDISHKYTQRNRYTIRINRRIDRSQIESLRSMMKSESHSELSLQDCLTSYVVTLLNRCGKLPVDKVTNATSYRMCSAPFINQAVAGNAIYVVPTRQMSESEVTNIISVARSIRESLVKARDPGYIEGYMSVASVYMVSAANEDKKFSFGTEDGTLSVNSNLALDWHSVHFGYQGASRFFTSGVSKYYLRVFSANPVVPGELGTTDAIDISFGVPAHLESRVQTVLRSDFESERWPMNVIYPVDSDY